MSNLILISKDNLDSDAANITSQTPRNPSPTSKLINRSPATEKSLKASLKFSASTPSKLEQTNATQLSPVQQSVSRSMNDDGAWWSDDEATPSTYDDIHRHKSSSLPPNSIGLQEFSDAVNDGTKTNTSNADISMDANSGNQLSSSVKSCDEASAFESFSCTDDDDNEGDESDPDSTSIDSSPITNR